MLLLYVIRGKLELTEHCFIKGPCTKSIKNEGNWFYHKFKGQILLIRDEKTKNNSFYKKVFMSNTFGRVIDKEPSYSCLSIKNFL